MNECFIEFPDFQNGFRANRLLGHIFSKTFGCSISKELLFLLFIKKLLNRKERVGEKQTYKNPCKATNEL